MSFHIVIPVSNTQSITRLQQKFQDAISCMTDAARLRAQGQWYLFKQRDGKSRLCSNQLQVQLFTDQAKKSLTLSTSPILTMDPQDWSSDVISHLHETIQSGAPGYRIWRPPGWSVSRHVELRNHTDSAQPCMPGVGVSAEQKKLGNERLQVEDVKVMETYGNIWKPSNIGNIQVLNQGSSPHRRCLARCTCVSVCVLMKTDHHGNIISQNAADASSSTWNSANHWGFQPLHSTQYPQGFTVQSRCRHLWPPALDELGLQWGRTGPRNVDSLKSAGKCQSI